MVWGKRIYADKLTGGTDIDNSRRRALGAFRKGVEESNLAPHFGVALGRDKALFVEHLPIRYPACAADFLRATGLTIDQYRACVTSL